MAKSFFCISSLDCPDLFFLVYQNVHIEQKGDNLPLTNQQENDTIASKHGLCINRQKRWNHLCIKF